MLQPDKLLARFLGTYSQGFSHGISPMTALPLTQTNFHLLAINGLLGTYMAKKTDDPSV